jgi:hypothetical protein
MERSKKVFDYLSFPHYAGEMNENPELIVARVMRDAASSLRKMTTSADVARVALREEAKFSQLVERLESQERATAQKQFTQSSAA